MKKTLMIAILICGFSILAVAQEDYHKIEVYGGYSFERTKGFPGDTLEGTTTFSGSTFSSTTGANQNHNLNGFKASAVYNFSRYFGAKVDFSGHFGSDTGHTLPGGNYTQANGFTLLVVPNLGGVNATQRDYKFLGGLQFKDNSKDIKIKPFAHGLFGSARQTTNFAGIDQQRTNLIGGNRSIKNNSFSMALGGGLDVRISKRIDIRVIQFDYNPVFTKEKTLVAVGDKIDTTITNLSAGSPIVTSLQSLKIPKHTQQNFSIGFGIVFH